MKNTLRKSFQKTCFPKGLVGIFMEYDNLVCILQGVVLQGGGGGGVGKKACKTSNAKVVSYSKAVSSYTLM